MTRKTRRPPRWRTAAQLVDYTVADHAASARVLDMIASDNTLTAHHDARPLPQTHSAAALRRGSHRPPRPARNGRHRRARTDERRPRTPPHAHADGTRPRATERTVPGGGTQPAPRTAQNP